MRDTESFDTCYAQLRDRLMLEAYALTGDASASRSAVRDAFAVAWHHWRKVARSEDAESYLRPMVHGRAQRRHVAHLWHRDKDIDANVRATLEALAKLSGNERKALILNSLSPMPLPAIARELGLPRADAERTLQSATSKFALARGIQSTDVRPRLLALQAPLIGTNWPRATIIRRSGTARRRLHTVVGSAAVVTALVGSGLVVMAGNAEPTRLSNEEALPGVTMRSVSAEAPELDPRTLLSAVQVERFGPRLDWAEGRTSDNLSGNGLVTPCQQERFADPEGSALVRTFTATDEVTTKKRVRRKGKQRTITRTKTVDRGRATQVVELSTDAERAQAAFTTTLGWYAGCVAARTQLLTTRTVGGVGDEAALFSFRRWTKAPARLTVGVARTGAITVTTLASTSTGRGPDPRASAAGLAAAVNALCGAPGAGTCAGPPESRAVSPYPIGSPPGMLEAIDLPPVAGAVGGWVGTTPERARANFASTRCDNTQFRGKGLRHALTRTFLFPATKREDTFGLTQTVATMSAKKAGSFLDEVRSRIRKCGEANLGTTVVRLSDLSTKKEDLTVWDLDVEISDERTINYWMAILRNGNAVSQVGFTPAKGMTMNREDFVAIAERAQRRLANLPSAKGTR